MMPLSLTVFGSYSAFFLKNIKKIVNGVDKKWGGYNEKCVKICRVDLFESRQVRN